MDMDLVPTVYFGSHQTRISEFQNKNAFSSKEITIKERKKENKLIFNYNHYTVEKKRETLGMRKKERKKFFIKIGTSYVRRWE